MQFLSVDNYKMLSEIVKEHITTDVGLFNNMFADFGNREQGPLIELNKSFLRILTDIVGTSKQKRVSFDTQCDTHKQNFLSYTPKHPETPVFSDMPYPSKEPLKNIDELIKDTIANRQYEIVPKIHPAYTEYARATTPAKKILDIQQIPASTNTSTYISNVVDLDNTYPETHNNTSHINQQHILERIADKINTLESIITHILTEVSTISKKINANTIDS